MCSPVVFILLPCMLFFPNVTKNIENLKISKSKNKYRKSEEKNGNLKNLENIENTGQISKIRKYYFRRVKHIIGQLV